ncbi:SH3 domain containing protein [Trichomonas vaginalis G3]|uniref:SH3 domain containing protein n=1 Tax=Trichomonas vaginalis (strain ATCC PRA-98 / G3) TaxID=412133 RepID=A2DEH2_TRIV3|nr:SH3-domain family [Trichomonas vaginalis G3]EAY21099.1 SH3 domain containing protein [Trichomonas vaginalis G3]KAI5539973.1 SH3-domain family [Trichomonas vaginalis G3]|eukprot:XP_001582085.1 SH3 domain containing protein [Trichomonas vaginalis G3]
MTEENSLKVLTYEQSVQAINDAFAGKQAFLKAVIKQIDAFLDSNKSFLEKLSKIDRTIPTKRNSGLKAAASSFLSANLNFVPIPGPTDDFASFEEHFNEILSKVMLSVFSIPPGLDIELELFESDFRRPLFNIFDKYSADSKALMQEVEKEIKALKASDDEFKKSHDKYLKQIKNIENIYQKIQQAPEDEKLKDQKVKAVDDLNVFLRDHKELHFKNQKAHTDFNAYIEGFLTKFEMVDEKLHNDITICYTEFANHIENIRTKKECTQEFLKLFVQPNVLDNELETALSPSKGMPLTQVTCSCNIPSLTFDISMILDKDTFATDSGKYVGKINDDYLPRQYDEIRVLKNNIVTIISEDDKGRYLVQPNPSFVGYVPKQFVDIAPDYICHTCLITENIQCGKVNLMQGSKVYVKNKIDDIAVVSTVDFQELQIAGNLVN